MSFRDYERLNVEEYLRKYGNITILELIEILDGDKDGK